MRFYYVLALILLGLVIAPSYAERKKVQSAPDTPETPKESDGDSSTPFVLTPQGVPFFKPDGTVITFTPMAAAAVPQEKSPIVRVKMDAASPILLPPRVAAALRASEDSVLVSAFAPLQESPRCDLVTAVYSVADLVIPIPMLSAVGSNSKPMAQPVATVEQELINNIQQNVVPMSWKAKGGAGTVAYHPAGCSLVVNASREVHAKIVAYLESLRKKLDTQIVLEMHVVTLSDALFADLEMAKVFALSDAAKQKAAVKFITQEQVAKFLERAQSDARTVTMAAPKIVALDGQECEVQVLDSQMFLTSLNVLNKNDQVVYVPKQEAIETGLKLWMRPQLSADGTKVSLETKMSMRQLAEMPVATTPFTVLIRSVDGKGELVPFTQHIQNPKVIAREIADAPHIPLGRSAMMYAGKATIKTVARQKVPMLADIPVLAELFSKDVPESQTNHLVVIVTPKLIKPECDSEECEAPKAQADRLTELLKAYHQACQAGKTDDARRLAIECLTLDPMCFGK